MSGVGFRGFRFGVPLLILGAASGASLPGEPVQRTAPPVFEAEVALVAAPVFVTDRSGKAVAGLTAEDFEVYDGGTRVPIVVFQSVDVDARAGPAAIASPELPVAVQAAAARQFLLLFDLQFSPPAGIIRARAAAQRFVGESLAADDLVAVATMGRHGLKMLTGLTTDRAYVARAIEGLGVVGALELASDPLGLGVELQAGSGGAGRAELADQEIAAEMGLLREGLRRQYQQRVIDLLASIEKLAEALVPLRGRKQVVLFSGGYAQEGWMDSSARASPIEAHAQSRRDNLGVYAVRDQMNKTFRTAGVSDVVIHAIDLRGIEGPVDVSSRTGRDVSLGEGVLGLRAIADNTGGRYVRQTNDFGLALREVDAISRHYYVLAFQPADPAPKAGRPRSVKVRVKREGVVVSARPAYMVPKPSPQADAAGQRLAAAEAIAKGLSGGPLGLDVVAMPYRDRDGNAAVPAVLHVDGPALSAAARGDRLKIQVYGYALGAGRVLDSVVLDTTLDLSKAGASLRSDGLHVLTTFSASPGAVDLRFFVRAGASGETGAIRRQVEVPAFVEGQPALSAALRSLPATGKVVAPLQTQSRPPLEIPFRLGTEPFLPDMSPALTPGQRTDLCVFAWRWRQASGDPLAVSGEIVRPDGAPVPLPVEGAPRVVPDADGFDRYLVTVVPPEVAPGDYVLRLTFRESASGWTAATETKIAVLQ